MPTQCVEQGFSQDLLPDDDLLPDEEDDTPLEFDDDTWEVFLPDGEADPLPEAGDFWVDGEE